MRLPESTRLPDWEQRLDAFMAASIDRAFEWGQFDCALFGTAAAAAQTGIDMAAEYRGRYDSREGSALALRELGKGTLLKTMDNLYPRKPVAFATRGDLLWTKGSVGVCMGAAGYFVSDGLISVPRAEWLKAWAV